jgi:hypothetical protein
MSRYYLTEQILPKSAGSLAANVASGFFGNYRNLFPYLFLHTPVLLILSLLGVAAAASRLRNPAERPSPPETYLAAWLACGWALLILSSYAPSRYYVTTYPAMAATAAILLGRRFGRDRSSGSPDADARWRTALLTLWLLINAAWLTHWLATLSYSQHEMSRLLSNTLPANSILIGEAAPGVSMDNRFMVVNVLPGLCNDRQPVERFAGRPRYLVIMDGRARKPYWDRFYPSLLAPERRLLAAKVIGWDVGVYRADDAP